MKSHLNLSQNAGVEVVRPVKPQAASNLSPRGRFQVEHWRDGRLVGVYEFPNGITNEGKDQILDTQFDAATQITTWYLGLIDNANFTALAAADTYDEIDQAGNGWDEFSDYTDPGNGDSATTRPVWNPDAASSQTITNGTVVVFDITATGTIKGLFLAGGGTAPENKGDHAAGSTLWATALFDSGDVDVQNGDQLKATYTVTA